MNRTEDFLRRLDEALCADIPPRVIERAKVALLDYIGVTLAGRYAHRRQADSLMADMGGAGKIYPVGISKPMSISDAVFLNGLNAHALDFDDGTNAGIIHLGSPVFSVLLALAQRGGFDGGQLLRAAIAGYEASFTMARSIQPMHKQRGYHATGTCGLLGIAVAVSRALGYDSGKTKAAFSTAAVSATGTLKVLEDASQLKPYNVGKTALLGLLATQMANAGFRAPDDALSGMAGFLCQLAGSEDVPFAPPLLDGTYAIEKAYIKPYAACRYTHPAIDIAREMRLSRAVYQEQIKSVRISTYALAVKKHDHTDIQGAASAKMSIPYNFAVTYVLGKTGMEAFAPECLDNADVRALTRKVVVSEDAAMTALFPAQTRAVAEVLFKDGRVLRGESALPKGEPENPLSPDEVMDKFTSLALYSGKSAQEARAIASAVRDVERNLNALLPLLR